MKIHDLHPAPGSVTRKTRVGRGIAAGKGKTAGRGTKGQKSRAGASIPAWFEGGQTPLHIRIPKLRGFRNINDIQYEVVNVGAISAAIETGKLEVQKGAPVRGLSGEGDDDLVIYLPSEPQPSDPPQGVAMPSFATSDRKSTRLNSSHMPVSRMPSSA